MPPPPPVERTVAVAPKHTVSVSLPRKTPDYQGGVDAFFRSTVASYATPTGPVIAAPTFMMEGGYLDQWDALPEERHRGDPHLKDLPKASFRSHDVLVKLAADAGLSTGVLAQLQVGRGTPKDLHTFTQAALSAMGTALSHTWQPTDVRRLMHSNATGFDCAGYVQQAYLFATGRKRDQLGWAPLSDEGLFNLPGHGFRQFMNAAELKAGDIIVFDSSDKKDPIGHRTIVFDQRIATGDDATRVAGAIGGQRWPGGVVAPSGAEFVGTSGTIRVVEMDSSYGSGGNPERGGVQRQTWLFNESTRKWAWLALGDPLLNSAADPRMPALPVWRIAYAGELYGMPEGLGVHDVLKGFYRHRAD